MPEQLRRCRWCRHPLGSVDKPSTDRTRKPHCGNRQCDWCLPCVHRREAAIAAGRPDLLDPGPATEEIPPASDETPPADS
jgi:hypothetical protein